MSQSGSSSSSCGGALDHADLVPVMHHAVIPFDYRDPDQFDKMFQERISSLLCFGCRNN